MAKRQKTHAKKKSFELQGEGFGHNPFAAALDPDGARSEALKAREQPQEEPAAPSSWSLEREAPTLTMRREHKGRGGREVTLVEGIKEASLAERKALARTLGKRLGCGASVEASGALLLQGDQRERLPEVLLELGAARVIGSAGGT